MRYPFLISCLIAAGMLVLLSLRSPAPSPASNVRNNTFAPFAVRVIDQATSRPIAGAQVQVVCLGGTAYETASYQTDARGRTQVMAYQNTPWLFLNVNVPGFQKKQLAIPTTNAIVKLSPIQ